MCWMYGLGRSDYSTMNLHFGAAYEVYEASEEFDLRDCAMGLRRVEEERATP